MTMREKTCCFTGHRDISPFRCVEISERAAYRIRELYKTGVRCFGVGGAVGFDTIMAQLLFRLRRDEMPDIKVILVYPFDGYMRRWDAYQKETYERLLPQYDKVVCVHTEAPL